MTDNRLWGRLLDYLGTWASTREVTDGVEVTFELRSGVPRSVVLVVTADQWEDYVTVIHGSEDPRDTPLRAEILATAEGCGFLIHDNHDWVPSSTRRLPPEDVARGPGEWVVTDDHGSVIDRFADVDESGDRLS